MARFESFYPLKPWLITQQFGESKLCIRPGDKDLSNALAKNNNVCPVGYFDFYNSVGLKAHNGNDVYAVDGQKLYYGGPDGVVEEIQTEEKRGLGIGIVTKERFDLGESGNHYIKTRYWHLKGFNVSMGQEVKAGDLIGYCDSTGFSTNTHLHLEVKLVERDIQGTLYNVLQDNGYYGCINPAPFFNNYFAQDAVLVRSIYLQIIDIMTKVVNKLKL